MNVESVFLEALNLWKPSVTPFFYSLNIFFGSITCTQKTAQVLREQLDEFWRCYRSCITASGLTNAARPAPQSTLIPSTRHYSSPKGQPRSWLPIAWISILIFKYQTLNTPVSGFLAVHYVHEIHLYCYVYWKSVHSQCWKVIRSSRDGRLGCLCFLAIRYNASLNLA